MHDGYDSTEQNVLYIELSLTLRIVHTSDADISSGSHTYCPWLSVARNIDPKSNQQLNGEASLYACSHGLYP